jgi:hypothetical protein
MSAFKHKSAPISLPSSFDEVFNRHEYLYLYYQTKAAGSFGAVTIVKS